MDLGEPLGNIARIVGLLLLLVAVPAVNQVAVVDLASMQVARTLDVPRAPQEVLIAPDGRTAYVSCDASHKVAVIDTKEWNVRRLIDAGPTVDGLAWAPASAGSPKL